MADILVRDVPEEVLAGVDAHAARLGLSRVEYIRRRLAADAATSGEAVSVADLLSFAEAAGDLTDPQVMGRAQIAATTIDLNQAAGSYDLFTGTTQAVVLESLILRCPNDAATAPLTYITIQTDDETASAIIDSVTGAVGNLTAEAQLSWNGEIYIGVGTKVQLTIAGGAEGAEYICTVVAKSRAVVSGGNLA